MMTRVGSPAVCESTTFMKRMLESLFESAAQPTTAQQKLAAL